MTEIDERGIPSRESQRNISPKLHYVKQQTWFSRVFLVIFVRTGSSELVWCKDDSWSYYQTNWLNHYIRTSRLCPNSIHSVFIELFFSCESSRTAADECIIFIFTHFLLCTISCSFLFLPFLLCSCGLTAPTGSSCHCSSDSLGVKTERLSCPLLGIWSLCPRHLHQTRKCWFHTYDMYLWGRECKHDWATRFGVKAANLVWDEIILVKMIKWEKKVCLLFVLSWELVYRLLMGTGHWAALVEHVERVCVHDCSMNRSVYMSVWGQEETMIWPLKWCISIISNFILKWVNVFSDFYLQYFNYSMFLW